MHLFLNIEEKQIKKCILAWAKSIGLWGLLMDSTFFMELCKLHAVMLHARENCWGTIHAFMSASKVPEKSQIKTRKGARFVAIYFWQISFYGDLKKFNSIQIKSRPQVQVLQGQVLNTRFSEKTSEKQSLLFIPPRQLRRQVLFKTPMSMWCHQPIESLEIETLVTLIGSFPNSFRHFLLYVVNWQHRKRAHFNKWNELWLDLSGRHFRLQFICWLNCQLHLCDE